MESVIHWDVGVILVAFTQLLAMIELALVFLKYKLVTRDESHVVQTLCCMLVAVPTPFTPCHSLHVTVNLFLLLPVIFSLMCGTGLCVHLFSYVDATCMQYKVITQHTPGHIAIPTGWDVSSLTITCTCNARSMCGTERVYIIS